MARGPVVVDTDVYSARLLPDSPLALRYEPLLVGRLEVLSFQTIAELRYGALLRGWRNARPRPRSRQELSRRTLLNNPRLSAT
jgi:predicted nucleic acid-binding protein